MPQGLARVRRLPESATLKSDMATGFSADDICQTELAARQGNGINVRLLWSRSTDLVTVSVADAANGDFFELVLADNDRPMDVFHHPYAHAAARGVEFRNRWPEPEVLPDAA